MGIIDCRLTIRSLNSRHTIRPLDCHYAFSILRATLSTLFMLFNNFPIEQSISYFAMFMEILQEQSAIWMEPNRFITETATIAKI